MERTYQYPPPEKNVPPAKVKFDLEERANETLDGLPTPRTKEPGHMECADCGIALPFDHFESGTDPKCKECRSTTAERELAEIRAKQFRKVSQVVVEAAKNPDGALPRLEMIFGEFMENMGGAKVFAALWAEHFKIGLSNRPGSHGILQSFHSIAKVNLELSKRQQQEDIIDMSDQQLRDRREQAQMRFLADILEDPGKAQMLSAVLRQTSGSIEEIPGVAEKMEAYRVEKQ